jgi:vacuolar-type H+-ATPase subunit D/Vma8
MPRKKVSNLEAPAGQVQRITCPACQSEVSSDGKTLHKKSANLQELLETSADLEEIEKGFKVLEDKHAKLQTRVTELELELKTEKEKTTHAPVQTQSGENKRRYTW